MKYLILLSLWLGPTVYAPLVLDSGKKCAKEGCALERKASQFYYRGNTWPGLICKKHNALYEDPANPFISSITQ